jgi:hypothetical protein
VGSLEVADELLQLLLLHLDLAARLLQLPRRLNTTTSPSIGPALYAAPSRSVPKSLPYFRYVVRLSLTLSTLSGFTARDSNQRHLGPCWMEMMMVRMTMSLRMGRPPGWSARP